MNRAVRRQQTKEPKEKPGKTARSAMPGVSTSAKGTAQPRAKGVGGLTPRFALDIISELRKVVWPKREDVVNLTIVIVIVTILIVVGQTDLFGLEEDAILVAPVIDHDGNF